MTWRVVFSDESHDDLGRLSADDRDAVEAAAFEWLTTGPPRLRPRVVLGTRAYDEEVVPGVFVTYVVHEEQRYVAVLRVRRRGPPP